MSEITEVKVGDVVVKLDDVPETTVGVYGRLEEEFNLKPKDLAEGVGFNYQIKMVTWTLQCRWPQITEDEVRGLGTPDFMALIKSISGVEVPEGL